MHGRAPALPFFDLRVQYLPLYGFCEYGSTLLLGPVPFAMRLPAVVFGVVSVVALRSLVIELCASIALADATAAIFAILPWAVHLSRIAWEPAAVFPFLLGGLAALARGLRLRSGRSVVVGGVLLAVGAYTYRAEAFDGTILAVALLLCRRDAAAAMRRPLLFALLAAVVCVAPLGLAVTTHPHFFWRDAAIATFGHREGAGALATFARNYAAHFDVRALFATGDGLLDHGPRYGVLYWWMLPFVLLGIALAWRLVPRKSAVLLYVWLALYPLGGALTNDGVPDFPRTLIGAPLACIFTALGLRAGWSALRPRNDVGERRRRLVVAAFLVTVVCSMLAFCREYFLIYPEASADAFRFGTASLFRTVRRFDATYARVCFGSLDWYNYETLIDYYLAASPLTPIEGVTEECRLRRSLIVVSDPSKTVANSRLLATQQNREGQTTFYIYGR